MRLEAIETIRGREVRGGDSSFKLEWEEGIMIEWGLERWMLSLTEGIFLDI